jgi:hypothetical protein
MNSGWGLAKCLQDHILCAKLTDKPLGFALSTPLPLWQAWPRQQVVKDIHPSHFAQALLLSPRPQPPSSKPILGSHLKRNRSLRKPDPPSNLIPYVPCTARKSSSSRCSNCICSGDTWRYYGVVLDEVIFDRRHFLIYTQRGRCIPARLMAGKSLPHGKTVCGKAKEAAGVSGRGRAEHGNWEGQGTCISSGKPRVTSRRRYGKRCKIFCPC